LRSFIRIVFISVDVTKGEETWSDLGHSSFS
jgi:hypothetical protein